MIGTVLTTEFIKLRRSVVPWITLAVMLAGPWVLALFMWIIRDPGRAASLGLLGQQAGEHRGQVGGVGLVGHQRTP